MKIYVILNKRWKRVVTVGFKTKRAAKRKVMELMRGNNLIMDWQHYYEIVEIEIEK